MKTPREILFDRHRHAEPKLATIRRTALAALATSRRAETHRSRPNAARWLWLGLRRAWGELIWPCRRAWGGLAAVWLGLLAANLQMKAGSPALSADRSPPAREVAQALREQRRWLAELLPPAEPSPARPPRSHPRPRSELLRDRKTC